MRLKQVRVGLDRFVQLDSGSLEIAPLKQDAGALKMALWRRDTAEERGGRCQRDQQAQAAPADWGLCRHHASLRLAVRPDVGLRGAHWRMIAIFIRGNRYRLDIGRSAGDKTQMGFARDVIEQPP